MRKYSIKFISVILRSAEILIRSIYALVAIILISAAMYLLGGHAFLSGMWGTDVRSYVGMMVWIDKYFPHIPFWYPLVGGGISITHSYPLFSAYIVSFITRVAHLTIIQSFSLLGFSAILIMAISIYAYVSLRFKNQTAALIASIFYLVSPITWTWLVNWGFYAETISHTFAVPAILFWDLFFVRVLKNNWGFLTRLFLFLTIVFLTLAMASHYLAGFAIIRFFFFYVFIFALFAKGERKKTLIKGVLALFVIGITAYLATLVFSVPFQHYESVTAEGGVGAATPNLEDMAKGLPSPLQVMGFQLFDKESFLYPLRYFIFPWNISALALIGLLFFWKDKRKATLTFFALYGFFFSLSAYYYWLESKITLPFLWFLESGTGWREMFIVLRFVWPTLAALAITSVVSLPFFFVKNKYVRIPIKLFVAIVSLAIAGYVLYYGQTKQLSNGPLQFKQYGVAGIDFRNIWDKKNGNNNIIAQDFCPKTDESKDVINDLNSKYKLYGGYQQWCVSPLSSYFPPLAVQDWCDNAPKLENIAKEELPSLCDPQHVTYQDVVSFWSSCKNGSNKSTLCKIRYQSVVEQLTPSAWPQFTLPAGYSPDPGVNKIMEDIAKDNPNARIDFSPYASNWSMIAPIYNINRNISQIHAYVANASLIHRFQGWQQIVYYLNDPQYYDVNLVNDIARWFGINYIFTVPNQYGESDIFQKAGWKIFSGSWGSGILKFPEKNTLVDFAHRKTFLVIGQNRVSAYDQVFTVSLMGVLPYNNAFLVWGKNAIDDYNLEELSKFDGVILQGYTYSSRSNANSLLSRYVTNGGSVFIDTGWQYVSPDYQSDNPLDIIPMNNLGWVDLQKTSEYALENTDFSKDINLKNFAPLIYQETSSWGVSTSAEKGSGVRDWGKVVLSAKGKPLVVAGQIGRGKVVWSGMNLFAHVKQKDNIYHDEIVFLQNLFSWLSDTQESKSFAASYVRTNPDRVDFTFQQDAPDGGYLLWKEGYFPDFHATLVKHANNNKTALSIYRAGPGWVLIRIPQVDKGDSMIYAYKKPFSEQIATIISAIVFISLLLFIIEAFRGNRSIVVFLIEMGEKKINRYSQSIGKKSKALFDNKDEEY